MVHRSASLLNAAMTSACRSNENARSIATNKLYIEINHSFFFLLPSAPNAVTNCVPIIIDKP